jgi:hypothetical protein
MRNRDDDVRAVWMAALAGIETALRLGEADRLVDDVREVYELHAVMRRRLALAGTGPTRPAAPTRPPIKTDGRVPLRLVTS